MRAFLQIDITTLIVGVRNVQRLEKVCALPDCTPQISSNAVSMSQTEILPVDRTEAPLDLRSEIFFREAEREMAAFIVAVEELYGIKAGQLAVEYWMDQLSKLEWSNREGPLLRQVTIAAASRLAKKSVEDFYNPSRRIAVNDHAQEE